MKSNTELIDAVVVGKDPDAFGDLIRRYERLVWATAWRVLRDYHFTQDVTQETFMIAHRRLTELRDPNSIGFWLSQIARREALRVLKKNESSRPLEGLDPPAREKSPEISEEYQALIAAIGDLPEHERLVTVLRHLNQHSIAEIAKLTGRPVGTVTKQLSRAMQRLQAVNLRGQSPETRVSSNESRLPNAQ